MIIGIVLGIFVLVTWKMSHQAQVECNLCLEFNGRRECVTSTGPDADATAEAAQSSVCARLASGVTEVVACGRLPRIDLKCQPASSVPY